MECKRRRIELNLLVNLYGLRFILFDFFFRSFVRSFRDVSAHFSRLQMRLQRPISARGQSSLSHGTSLAFAFAFALSLALPLSSRVYVCVLSFKKLNLKNTIGLFAKYENVIL